MRNTKKMPKYPNLVAEMSRAGVEISDLCQATGKSKSSIYDYIRGAGGGDFSIGDAIVIQETFFPSLTMSYLFSKIAEPNAVAM